MPNQTPAEYHRTRRGNRRKNRSIHMNEYTKGQLDLIKFIQMECKAIQLESNGIDIVLDMINFINDLEPITKQYYNK
jgi:hypothetical protein